MRKYILSIFLFISVIGISQVKYTIKGSMKNINGAAACVYYKIDGKDFLDTATITNGKFVINGKIPYDLKATVFVRPIKYSFIEQPNRSDQIDVYLESGTITINSTDSLKYATIGGTPLNNDYRQLVKLLAPFKVEEEALYVAKRRAQDIPDEMPKVMAAYQEMANRQNPIQFQFINTHLNSLVALDLLSETVDPAFQLSTAKTYFNKFPKRLQESSTGKTYSKLFNVAVGCQAPDFSSKNMEGEKVTLSSYKGKYVLLDFWASWCMPCRADNPYIKKIYEKYKDQNFAILGYSLDYGPKGKGYWQKAINMDGVTWDQASDLEGFQSVPSKLYSITAVPTNFLIDPSGKIIAKNLHREALENKLSALLKAHPKE